MFFGEVGFIFIIHSGNVIEHFITLCESKEFLSINNVSARTALFRVIRKHVVICYWHSRTTCWSHPQGSRIQENDSWALRLRSRNVGKNPKGLGSWTLRMGSIGCPETSVRNYHYSMRNNAEECSFQLPRSEVWNHAWCFKAWWLWLPLGITRVEQYFISAQNKIWVYIYTCMCMNSLMTAFVHFCL
jgi:hypothetical protein